MSKINDILLGWANLIKDAFGQLEPAIKKIAEERLNICHICDIRLDGMCDPRKTGIHIETGHLKRGCGCNIAAKAMNPNSKCPLGKW